MRAPLISNLSNIQHFLDIPSLRPRDRPAACETLGARPRKLQVTSPLGHLMHTALRGGGEPLVLPPPPMPWARGKGVRSHLDTPVFLSPSHQSFCNFCLALPVTLTPSAACVPLSLLLLTAYYTAVRCPRTCSSLAREWGFFLCLAHPVNQEGLLLSPQQFKGRVILSAKELIFL